jgi:hypothetical protein
MKKTKIIAILTALLLLAGIFPMTALANPTNPSGDIDGDSEVISAVLNVTLPANLNFALNPLELGTVTAGSQITSTNYIFVNSTGAPVEIGLDITATGAAGVRFVPDASTLKQDDTSVVDKDIFFAALGASTVNAGTLAFDTIPGTASFTYAANPTTTTGTFTPLVPAATPTTATGRMVFALGAATLDEDTPANSALALNDRGVASFQFFAQMNTYAAWANNDVTVKAEYTLTALRATTFTSYGDADGSGTSRFIPSSVNQLRIAPPVGFANPERVSATDSGVINATLVAGTVTVTVPFNFGGTTPTNWQVGGTAFTPAAGSGANVSANTLTFTYTTAGARVITFDLGSTTYTLRITTT